MLVLGAGGGLFCAVAFQLADGVSHHAPDDDSVAVKHRSGLLAADLFDLGVGIPGSQQVAGRGAGQVVEQQAAIPAVVAGISAGNYRLRIYGIARPRR